MIKIVGLDRMGLCPAAVEWGNGEANLLVNALTFPAASDFSRKFYIAHELGHYLLKTDSEEEADAFAIQLLAGTERKSLKKSLMALYELGTIPYSRMERLYELAKHIDKNHK